MDIGTTVGSEPSGLSTVPDRYDFAELAIGEGELPLRYLDAEAVRSAVPDGVDLTVHLPFRQPLATGVEELDVAVREYLIRCLDAAAALGAEAAVCHATARDPTSEHQRDDLVETIRVVSVEGRERGVDVHVENVGQTSGGVALDVLSDLAVRADASLCFDVGHAFMEADRATVERFLDLAGHRIDYCHVQDVRARGDSHIPVGAGEIDYGWVGDRLRETADMNRAAIEVFTDDEPLIRDSAERFARAVQTDW